MSEIPVDTEVWAPGAARHVQRPFQPKASGTPVDTDREYICYRGIYYYSTSPTHPYVCLKRVPGRLPIPCCCYKQGFDKFRSELSLFDSVCIITPETSQI